MCEYYPPGWSGFHSLQKKAEGGQIVPLYHRAREDVIEQEEKEAASPG